MIILDVGPSSVRVEWSQNTLPPDDGGSRIRTIRLTYRTTVEEVWSEEEALVVDVGRGFTILSGLRDRTTYMVRMQAGNEIGTYVCMYVCVYKCVYIVLCMHVCISLYCICNHMPVCIMHNLFRYVIYMSCVHTVLYVYA